MKAILIALLLFAPVAAKAGSPEESYRAARDAYIAKFRPIDDGGKIDDDALIQGA